jgi:hypothetical protein
MPKKADHQAAFIGAMKGYDFVPSDFANDKRNPRAEDALNGFNFDADDFAVFPEPDRLEQALEGVNFDALEAAVAANPAARAAERGGVDLDNAFNAGHFMRRAEKRRGR